MKSTLSKINVNSLLVFTQYIFLHPFIFNLSRPLYLKRISHTHIKKWVSHRLHILGCWLVVSFWLLLLF